MDTRVKEDAQFGVRLLQLQRLIGIPAVGNDRHVLRADAETVGPEARMGRQGEGHDRHLVVGANHAGQVLRRGEAEVVGLHLGPNVHTEIVYRKAHVFLPPFHFREHDWPVTSAMPGIVLPPVSRRRTAVLSTSGSLTRMQSRYLCLRSQPMAFAESDTSTRLVAR